MRFERTLTFSLMRIWRWSSIWAYDWVSLVAIAFNDAEQPSSTALELLLRYYRTNTVLFCPFLLVVPNLRGKDAESSQVLRGPQDQVLARGQLNYAARQAALR